MTEPLRLAVVIGSLTIEASNEDNQSSKKLLEKENWNWQMRGKSLHTRGAIFLSLNITMEINTKGIIYFSTENYEE